MTLGTVIASAFTSMLLLASAHAATYDVFDSGMGWINQTGAGNGANVNGNYVVGNCGNPDCQNPTGEFRDFFEFTVPNLSGPITSVQLVINTAGVRLFQSPSLTVAFTSTSSLAFGALGTGTVYGSTTYTSSNANLFVSTALNSAAISALGNGGFNFIVSGRVTSPVNFGALQPDQLVFGGSSSDQAELIITTADTPLPAAYITNSDDGTVSVIDTTNNTVVMTIPVGRKPFGVAVTPDGSKVYIANSGDDTVSVIDTATNTVTGSPIAVGTDPVGVAVTPDGKTVYVTNQGDGTVSVINTATNTVIGSAIDVGCTTCGKKTTNIPTGIAVTPDGSKVYVGNIGTPGYASVIATASNTVTTINTKKVTTGVAVTPNGSKVYLGSLNGVVLAIDVATNSVSNIGVGSGSEGVAVTPDGSKVYVANSAVGTVSVINTGTNKVIGSIAVGSDPQGVSVTSDGSKVYVANEGNGTVDGTVSIIDTATNTVETSTVTVGKAPLAFGIFLPPPKPK
jgi:YVTN family beta-propeller protein